MSLPCKAAQYGGNALPGAPCTGVDIDGAPSYLSFDFASRMHFGAPFRHGLDRKLPRTKELGQSIVKSRVPISVEAD